MENYLDMLPEETLNKIMLYISHHVSDILKGKINQYSTYITRFESYEDDDAKPMSFTKYTLLCMKINKSYKRYRFELKEILI